MNTDSLLEQIKKKQSFLCVGLDSDPNRIPAHLLSAEDPVFEFNRAMIEATAQYAVAYKPNLAFYEANGAAGWESLRKTLSIIPPEILTIADAKRGDIGNTSGLYARAFFETLDVDAITVAPYMGEDSVGPFLQYPDKWVFLLALTSNPSAADFQWYPEGSESPLFQKVITTANNWTTSGKYPGILGFVAGATRPEEIGNIRALAPESWLLVPGVGAQGGDLQQVAHHGLNDKCGLLVNSSRGILYAGAGENFAQAAAEKAAGLQTSMASLLREKGILS